MNGYASNPLRSTLRNNATGGIIVDTREPGLVELRNKLSTRMLAPDTLKPVVVRTVRFIPAEVPQTTATRLWTAHPSKLPATVGRMYRPPHYTSNQEHFEYHRDELEQFDSKHFNKKNEMTEYLRSAIRTKVNLKATGH